MSDAHTLRLAIQAAVDLKQENLVEYSFNTAYGMIDVMATLIVHSDKGLEFQDVCVYPRDTHIPKGVLQTTLLKEIRMLLEQAKKLGYGTVKILGKRVAGSSAAKPGREVFITKRTSR